jgi:hypothetical protein
MSPSESRVCHHAALWVNDTPDEYLGNGREEWDDLPYPHGHIYHAERNRHVVQVSFEAMNGKSVRVSFDPETGDVRTQDITKAQT